MVYVLAVVLQLTPNSWWDRHWKPIQAGPGVAFEQPPMMDWLLKLRRPVQGVSPRVAEMVLGKPTDCFEHDADGDQHRIWCLPVTAETKKVGGECQIIWHGSMWIDLRWAAGGTGHPALAGIYFVYWFSTKSFVLV